MQFKIVHFDEEAEAKRLLEAGQGEIDRLEVLDILTDLLAEQELDATFLQENGKVLPLDMVRRLRGELGVELRLTGRPECPTPPSQ